MEQIAYLSDCNSVPLYNLKYLKNLNYLIVDCLKFEKHPSHFNLESALDLINLTKPKKAILTNLHTDLDYFKLKKKLPKNIIPAYDGLSFSFQIKSSITFINFLDDGLVIEEKVSATFPSFPIIILWKFHFGIAPIP